MSTRAAISSSAAILSIPFLAFDLSFYGVVLLALSVLTIRGQQ